MSGSPAQFPVLDWNDWSSTDADATTRARFLDELRDAAVGLGFFHLRNSPLDQVGLRQRLFDLSSRFFALDFEKRQSIAMNNSPHFRGYCQFAQERTLGAVDNRDQIEFGSGPAIWSELTTDGKTDPSTLPDYLRLPGPNQYVSNDVLSGHEETVTAWFEACNALNAALTGSIEKALELDPGALMSFIGFPEDKFDTMDTVAYERIPSASPGLTLPYARLKTIRYPRGVDETVDGVARSTESHQGPGSQGVGAHRDGGWLTLLAVSDVPGLEVQDVDGTWLPVPPVKNAIIVNFGQQLEVLTNGLIRAATHRVTVASGSTQDRLSAAYFSTPALNAIIRKPLAIGASIYAAADRAWTARGGTRHSEVPDGDLHALGKPYGEVALEVLVRSHADVVQRWYPWLVKPPKTQ